MDNPRSGLEGSTLKMTDPYQAFAIPLPTPPVSTEDDEWEYEYSETDVDTYYVTVDLSTPTLQSNRRSVVKAGRGGYKVHWIRGRTNGRKQETASNLSRGKPASGIPDEEDGDDGDLQGEEQNLEQNLDEEAFDEAPLSKRQKMNESPDPEIPSASTIQILDLHTANPIIAYKNHAFSCTWAGNLGTDLLFTRADANLPNLRSLPNDVSLLAASSTRLASVPIVLEPKPGTTQAILDEQDEQRRQEQTSKQKPMVKLNVGGAASVTRKDQGRFLERLMTLKAQKGEKDDVTVYTSKRASMGMWKAQIKKKREEERVALRSIVTKGGEGEVLAVERLRVMDAEDVEWAEAEASAKRRKGILDGTEVLDDEIEDEEDETTKPRGGGRRPRGRSKHKGLDAIVRKADLSVSTPRSWSDI